MRLPFSIVIQAVLTIMPRPIKVALVTTVPTGRYSSMVVYADMVEHAIVQFSSNVCFTRINLLEGFPKLSWLPPRILHRLQLLWLMAQSSSCLTQVSADVYHMVDGSFAHALHSFQRPSVVVTVHDLIPVLQSKGEFDVAPPSKLANWLIERNLQALRQRQYFCAVSDATKDDIGKYVSKDKRVTVIPLLLRESILKHIPKAAAPWAERITGSQIRTILHIGNASFYKNRKAVIEFSRLMSGSSLQLVIAGAAPEEATVNGMIAQHRSQSSSVCHQS